MSRTTWVGRTARGLIALAVLLVISYGCVLLGSAFGPWAYIGLVAATAVAWHCWDRYVLHK